MKHCTHCAAVLDEHAAVCVKCGHTPTGGSGFCRSCGVAKSQESFCLSCGAPPADHKKRLVALLLCFFLGGLGAHKFYQGSWGWGIVYAVFCLTFIPGLVALAEGIILLTKTDEQYILETSKPSAPFRW